MLPLQQLGRAGLNQPVYAGTLVFGLTTLILVYLIVWNDQIESTRMLKGLAVVMFVLTVLSTFWPLRPWPH